MWCSCTNKKESHTNKGWCGVPSHTLGTECGKPYLGGGEGGYIVPRKVPPGIHQQRGVKTEDRPLGGWKRRPKRRRRDETVKLPGTNGIRSVLRFKATLKNIHKLTNSQFHISHFTEPNMWPAVAIIRVYTHVNVFLLCIHFRDFCWDGRTLAPDLTSVLFG